MRGAHVCASNCICSVDVDTVFRIYVDKTFQENVHIRPARSWLCVASIASPFIFWQSMWEDFTLRNLYYTISGRVYTYFLLFGYVDAFGMLFTAKFLSSLTPETNIEFFDTYLHMTIACACVSLPILWIIKNRLMVQTYNWMWWSTDTPREHFSNWIWDNNVYDDFGPDMDDHRASALSFFRPAYYKHDLRVKIGLTPSGPNGREILLHGSTMPS